MNSYRYKTGVTLVEILTVVAIVGILATLVITIASRIDNKAKAQLTQNSIAILGDALEQFADYGYSYNNVNYSKFKFPLDCNDFTQAELETTLANELGAISVLILPVDPNNPTNHQPKYSGSEVLYFFLSRVPACRETLERIDSSLITSEDDGGNQMKIEINFAGTVKPKTYPLNRFVDPWLERDKTSRTGKTLRYDYYYEYPFPFGPVELADMQQSRRAFPVITSAGPDRIFDTPDDVTSR
ncbi:MAG: type II secretion system protein [Planctomycetota bacterium]|jgi:prepilin-type N-terminal cleavage/methylation domain-containing protein